MKKKLTLVITAIVLVAAIAVGGSLAYFTATDKADNVFTVGNVKIDLDENFTQNSKLVPGTNEVNNVAKEVWVENTGSEEAYVRVHIAIPAILDDGDPTFDAGKNVLHFNYSADSVGEGLWDWSKTTGAPYDAAEWNYYPTEINGINYNVYVVTYEAALAKDAKTLNAMDQVYLDSKVTNEDIAKINEVLVNGWHMYVVAEGAQAEGFDNAYDALNTAFGVPGTYTVEFAA